MRFSEFNAAPIDDAKTVLHACVHIPSWTQTLSQQRPYSSRDELLSTAANQAERRTWQDIEAAATHPRIGEKKAKQALTEREAAFSDAEQSGVKQDETTQRALFEGNMAYEEKFGFIFLIKAAGLSSDQMLSALNRVCRMISTPKNKSCMNSLQRLPF